MYLTGAFYKCKKKRSLTGCVTVSTRAAGLALQSAESYNDNIHACKPMIFIATPKITLLSRSNCASCIDSLKIEKALQSGASVTTEVCSTTNELNSKDSPDSFLVPSAYNSGSPVIKTIMIYILFS